MGVVTRQNRKIYNYVKSTIETNDSSTQTCINDIEDNLHKKRKIEDTDPDDVSIKSDDTITDDESSDEYITDIEEDEVEEICVKPNIIDMIQKNILNHSKNKANVEDIEETLDEEEEKYYKSLSKEDRERLSNLYTKIITTENSSVPVRFQILNADISNYIKNIALQKYETLQSMDESSGEYNKLNNWITNLCKIPFGKYVDMPVSNSSPRKEIRDFLMNTKSVLNENVYGHDSAKDQIIRIVAQWISNPKSKGNVIGIHGNPGVGKTTLIKEGICKALNLPFAFIPLGGAYDSSYLDGHSYTYEGSSCGKIVDVIKNSKCMNPVLYFDELDKISDSQRGQEIVNVLIHLTDPSQNSSFQDKYFSDISFDLSKCLIIFTYNNNDIIDPILKDRMIIIETKDYSNQDKVEIMKNHLIPNIKKEFDIKNVNIEDSVINHMIERTQNEAGVRNLKRSIENIISNMNLEKLLDEETDDSTFKITKEIINKYIKKSDIDINPSLAHLYL